MIPPPPSSSTGCSRPASWSSAFASSRNRSSGPTCGACPLAPYSGRDAFLMGVLMWPAVAFFTNSTMHTLAHSAWAQVMMLAGAAQLALVRGQAPDPLWELTMAFGFPVSGPAFLVHEQNPWFFQRSAFLHHLIGWTILGSRSSPSPGPTGRAPSSRTGFALRFRRARGPALLRPRPGADLRPPVAVAGCPTDEPCARSRRGAPHSHPGGGVCPRHVAKTTPDVPSSGLRRRRHGRALTSTRA